MLVKTKKNLALKITLGLVLALPVGTALAADSIVDYDTLTVKPNAEFIYHGEGDKKADFTAADIKRSETQCVYGIFVGDKAVLNAASENINISVTNTEGEAIAVYAGAFTDKDKHVINGGTLNLGDDTTKNVTVKVDAKKDALGLNVIRRSTNNSEVEPGIINVKGENVSIEANSAEGLAVGIWAQNNKTVNDGNPSTVKIDADNTYINVTSGNKVPTAAREYNNIGIVNYSGAKVIINGNLTVESGTFLSTRGGAITEINKDGKGTVKINGDINFNYDQPTSGTSVDAIVDLNLTTQDSVFNGNIFVNGNPYPPDGKKEVGGMTLGLANGAQWNTNKNSFVNKLNFNDGIINVNGGEGQEVKLGDINGSGGTVNMLTSSDLKTAKLSIGTIESDAVNKIDLKAKAAAGPKLTINYTGITADDLNNVTDDLGGLAKNISVAEGTNTGLTATANVAEGLLKGSVSADLDTAASGSTVKVDSVKQNKESSTMTSMRNIASVAIVSWRQEDSTLSQRLGELRNSEGDQGIWARMNRGEFEYSGAYKNQYNFFQLGYDKAAGSWHYGAAISHNDGKTTYDSGKGENKSTSLSLYGTWLGDRGHYTDIVLKQGRLSNEYDNYAAAGHTHGDYDAWGTSLSSEYGMKVGLDNGWYVTPQAQLTLMRIGGEDYTTNNGIKVNQDTLESCVGRVGFEMGKTISDKGSIYAKASLLHEFAGNADTYLNLNSISNSYSQDIGGTWYEAGLGFNFKTTDNSYVYADVVKTFGDDIKTPWQWNVGARWSF
ncbi:autotransporter outer membrane beta-barrel domain-containing protein [Phascolarctobacterium faecium]|uniref:autotransporter outer membrane beta-barrel domain-containing protein n=1 Tax=Phascolarctobacterium faecium TaxID=33025 RepID=UPI003A924329